MIHWRPVFCKDAVEIEKGPPMKSVQRGVILILMIAATLPGSGQGIPNAREVERLSRYLGTWQYEGEDKTASTDRRVACKAVRQWIVGGLYVESRRECTTPRGDLSQLEVYGYDPIERRYVYWGFNGPVVSTYVTPAIDGMTIAWTGIGVSRNNRCVVTFANNLASTVERCDVSSDGGRTWSTVAEGKSTKAP
jgi:hypothetical protein